MEDQEAAAVTADQAAVYPYAMDRLDDAISFIPADDFEDLWKLLPQATGERGLAAASTDQLRQSLLNPRTGKRWQAASVRPTNPTLAQLLAVSLESVSLAVFCSDFLLPSSLHPLAESRAAS